MRMTWSPLRNFPLRPRSTITRILHIPPIVLRQNPLARRTRHPRNLRVPPMKRRSPSLSARPTRCLRNLRVPPMRRRSPSLFVRLSRGPSRPFLRPSSPLRPPLTSGNSSTAISSRSPSRSVRASRKRLPSLPHPFVRPTRRLQSPSRPHEPRMMRLCVRPMKRLPSLSVRRFPRLRNPRFRAVLRAMSLRLRPKHPSSPSLRARSSRSLPQAVCLGRLYAIRRPICLMTMRTMWRIIAGTTEWLRRPLARAARAAAFPSAIAVSSAAPSAGCVPPNPLRPFPPRRRLRPSGTSISRMFIPMPTL